MTDRPMTFDGTHFWRGKKRLGIVAKQTKTGRWQYRDNTGHLLASGMQPADFAKE